MVKTDFEIVDAEVLGVSGPGPFPAREAALTEGLDQGGRIEVRVAQGLNGFLALEPHWQALVASMPERRFMHAFGWQLAYLQHLETAPESMHFFSFFAGERAVAIFPLRHRRYSVAGIPMWFWELPSHPHLVLGDALVAPSLDAASLMPALIESLNRLRNHPWDVLRLADLLDDACALKALRATTLKRTLYVKTGASMYFPCADLETALGNTSSAFRRNLRRQRKKLGQHGAITLTLAREGQALEVAFAEFLRLETSGWKGRAGRGSAILLHPRLFRFYSALKDYFSAGEGCQVALLKLDGKPVAAQFSLISGGSLYLQKIAYDEAWSAEAPGNLLLYDVLEHCCAGGHISRLSLVTAPPWAVGRWNPCSMDVWDASVFRASLPGLLYFSLRWCKYHMVIPAQAKLRQAWTALLATLSPSRA